MSGASGIAVGAAIAVLAIGGAVISAQTVDEADVHNVENGISSPVPVKRVKPQQTEAARKARIEGTVLLRAIVRADGTVGNVTVERSLDKESGLDDAAIAAAKQWIFEPARRVRDKQLVAVRATIEMMFTLRP
jgi:TonB family protein